MLLAIDIGNSSIKFGIFDGTELIKRFAVPTDRQLGLSGITDAVAGRIDQKISDAMVVSVVPELDQKLREYLQLEHNVDPVFVTSTFDFGLKIKYEPVSSAGADRLVAASAAARKYGVPVVVCDFGTASTIDAVNSGREYLGGIIAPGTAAMAESLHLKTSKLPLVQVAKPANPIGSSTIASIESGIFWGYIGLAEKLITMISAELSEKPAVIATGGLAKTIAAETSLIDHVAPDLVLEGLNDLKRQKTNG